MSKKVWDRVKHNRYAKAHRDRVYALICEAKNRPCADCGQTFHPCMMDFDHVRGKKLGVLGELRVSKRRALIEIAKCEVVCANCHRLRTWLRSEWT